MGRVKFLVTRLLSGSKKNIRSTLGGQRISLAVSLSLCVAGLAMLLAEEKSAWSKYSFQQRFFRPSLRRRSYAIENHLRYVPIALVYLLDKLGLKAKHTVVERSLILMKGLAMQGLLVVQIKQRIPMERPNGELHAFPSSHTARAFAIASFMQLEYGERSAWYTATGYSFAVATAALRLRYSHHWLPDVLVDAGLGMLLMQLSYATYRFAFTRRMQQKES